MLSRLKRLLAKDCCRAIKNSVSLHFKRKASHYKWRSRGIYVVKPVRFNSSFRSIAYCGAFMYWQGGLFSTENKELKADISSISNQMKGKIVTRDDPEFSKLDIQWNVQYNSKNPLFFAMCESANDVSLVLKELVNKHNLKLSVRSTYTGGHLWVRTNIFPISVIFAPFLI